MTTAFDRVADQILAATGHPIRNGSAHCPAHADANPSLSVTDRDGKVLVRCHAGCDIADVLAALGMRPTDLFDEPAGADSRRRRIVTTYPYVDAEGELLFEVVRYDPKGFRQRRPDGRGGWEWKLGDVDRPLYRLPDVMWALAEGEPVWVVEGEKDADALAELEYVATTCPGGAGKWRPEHTATLARAEVVIVADDDEPGHRHAAAVADQLTAAGCAVQCWLPGEGFKDIAEHLGAGLKMDKLRRLHPRTETANDAETPPETGSVDSANSAQGSGPWGKAPPKPIPLGIGIDLVPFPTQAFPAWIGDFVEALARSTQTPADLAGSLALAALATAAGGRVRVTVRDDWSEPLNLYLAVGMAPGERKTAVTSRLIRPLRAAERNLITDAMPKVTEATVRKEVAVATAKRAKEQAIKTESEADLAAAIKAATRAEELAVPALPRLLADDATPEALRSLLAEQGGRIAIITDEGGPFDQMAGKYSSGPTLVNDVYLKSHSSGGWLATDRVGRQHESVADPALTLGLAVQPAVLRDIVDRPGFAGQGLLARFLWAMPDSKVGYRLVDPDGVPENVSNTFDANLIKMVNLLAEQSGEEDTDPKRLSLSADAQDLLLEWRKKIERDQRPDGRFGSPAAVVEWASKLAGATVRIAGLLHLATHRDVAAAGSTISGQVMRSAIEIAEYFARHALGTFDFMAVNEDTRNARAVVRWWQDKKLASFSRRDVHSAHRSRFARAVEVDPVLELLEERDWIRKQEEPERRGPGRPPSPTYVVNPSTSNARSDQ